MLAARLDGFDRAQMRALADSLRNKWKTAVIVLRRREDSNVSIISAVTKDLTAKVHAGKLAGAVAKAVGGKGGGRPGHGRSRRQGSGRARTGAALKDVEACCSEPLRSWQSPYRAATRKRLTTLIRCVVIVGAGPTGLACAIELSGAA